MPFVSFFNEGRGLGLTVIWMGWGVLSKQFGHYWFNTNK